MQFNAIAELEAPNDPDTVDEIIDALSEFAPAIAPASHGGLEVTFTLTANAARQAVTIAAALTHLIDHPLRALRVLPTADFDALTERVTAAPTLSVSQAAERLGISPQAAHKAIRAGRLHGARVGGRWAVSEESVAEYAAGR